MYELLIVDKYSYVFLIHSCSFQKQIANLTRTKLQKGTN